MLSKSELKKLSAVVTLLLATSQALSETIQSPEQCLQSLKGPCLVYVVEGANQNSMQKVDIEKGQLYLQASQGAQLQLNKNKMEDHELYSLELIKGKIQFNSKNGLAVNGISMDPNKKYFVERLTADMLQIFDRGTLEISTYIREPKKDESGKIKFTLQKSEFPAKERLVKFLASYYVDKKEFHKDLQVISVDYKIKLQKESYKLQTELKKSQQRAIASAELEEQNKKERQLKTLQERKKSRALFFMRTFEE